MAAPKKHDYTLMEADWMAGLKTTRQIADDYEKVTGLKIRHATIFKEFEKRGVARDLKAKIRMKAEELVAKETLEKETRKGNKQSFVSLAKERDVIETAARVTADVLIAQREDIVRCTELTKKLVGELELTTDNRALFEQLGELLHSPNEKGVDKLNEAYQKVIAFPGRVDSLKKIAETLKNLIGLERQSYGLSDNSNGDADKPKEVPIDQTDAAKRIAFLLVLATKG